MHGMQGFDYDRAGKELKIPDEFQVEAMAAVGRPGPKDYFLKNCRLARVRMTDGRFRKAYLRGHSELNSFGHS